MNYRDTLIEVGDYCPLAEAQVPRAGGARRAKAVVEYELLAKHPYTYTEEDLLARQDPGGQTGLMAALMRRGRLSAETRLASRLVARDVMSGPVVAAPANTRVGEAAQRMLEARRKVLPITDGDGRLIGVADRADLLRAVREAFSAGQPT